MSAVVAISGDLGSGKSTVSREVATQLGFRRIGTGDVQRQIAEELGMSTLELNRHSESRAEFDQRIDAALAAFAETPEPLVADSRLAWFLLPNAFKVHLVVEPSVGAKRVVARGSRTVESYASSKEALAHIRARRESERRRFRKWHGVDIARLRNYHLVLDTTIAPPEMVAGEIVDMFRADNWGEGNPTVLIAPSRIYPTQRLHSLAAASAEAVFRDVKLSGYDRRSPIVVGYSRPFFFAIDGHTRLSAALRANLSLVPSRLGAENGESVVGGISASDYLVTELSPAGFYDWEDAHGFRFAQYPFQEASTPA